jgi:hypothetical protein
VNTNIVSLKFGLTEYGQQKKWGDREIAWDFLDFGNGWFHQ